MSFLRFASAEVLEHARDYAELLQYVIQFVKQDQHPTFLLYGVKKPKDPHHSQPDNVIILIYAGHPYGKTEDTGWIFFQKNKTKRLLYRCGSKHINT